MITPLHRVVCHPPVILPQHFSRVLQRPKFLEIATQHTVDRALVIGAEAVAPEHLGGDVLDELGIEGSVRRAFQKHVIYP